MEKENQNSCSEDSLKSSIISSSSPISGFSQSSTISKKEAKKIIITMIKFLSHDDFYIHGGYVRDSIIGEDSKDIDIYIKSIHLKYMKEEKNFFLFKEEDQTTYNMKCTKFECKIVNQIIKLDVMTNTIMDRDFTCNNLCLYKGVMKTHNDSIDIFTCLNDIRDRKLVPMFPESWLKFGEKAENRIHYVKMIMRALKMMRRGWKLYPHINGKELKFQTPPLKKEKDELEEITCIICQSRKPFKDLTCVILKCSHKFHIKCLFGVVKESSPNAEKCPLCRKKIEF